MSDLDIRWALSLKAARARADLTQVELAKAIGASQQIVSSYEAGLTRPTDERRILLARALGTTVADLFPYPEDDANGDEDGEGRAA